MSGLLPNAVMHIGRSLSSFSAHPAICGLLLLIGATLFVADLLAPQIEQSVAPANMSHEQRLAFTTPVPETIGFPFYVRGAAPSVSATGPLVLFEDDFPLGPSDALHEDIRDKGQGLYSHWVSALYFSSSDRSDPRSNGRVYSYRVQSALRPVPHLMALIFSTLGVLGLTAHIARRRVVTLTAARAVTRPRQVGAVLVLLGVLGLTALRLVPPLGGTLDPPVIKHGAPLAYLAPIAAHIPWPLRAARRDSPVPGSALTIYEDGKPVGQYEADPRRLRSRGGGRYALYGDRLVFSTPDGTDPRTNGRTYTWRLPNEVHPLAWTALLTILTAGIVLTFRGSVLPGLIWLADRSASRVGPASTYVRTKVLQLLLIIFASVVAVYFVTLRWEQGSSSLLGFLGYLPMSDALGYFWCAVFAIGFDASTTPQFPWEWCTRRIFYPTALASYLGISGWRPQMVLLIQAVVIGCAVASFAAVVARYVSRLAAIVTALALFVVAYEIALGNFMTEALGFPLGLLGLTLLLAYAGGQRQTVLLYAGLAFFSVAMFGRMGALLILPLLGLWACVTVLRNAHSRKIVACFGALISVAAGPILQAGLALALGGDPAHSGSNYSTVLYGLSTGTRDWSQSLRDFEEFFQSSEAVGFAKVQAAALANIRANPSVFFHSVLQNVEAFATGAFAIGSITYIDQWLLSLTGINHWLIPLCLVGVTWCMAHVRRPIASLLLAIFVGELISIPLIYIGDSDHRVLAVSVGARVLLVGIGITWLTNVVLGALLPDRRPRSSTLRTSDSESRVDVSTKTALAVGASLVVLTVLPATVARQLFTLPSIAGIGCPDGQKEVVSRIGRESMAVAVGSPRNPMRGPFLGVRVGQVENDPTRRGTWWANDLPELQKDTLLLYAIQLMPDAREQLVPLIFEGPLPNTVATALSFCYDPKPTSIGLGGSTLFRALSVKAVPIS